MVIPEFILRSETCSEIYIEDTTGKYDEYHPNWYGGVNINKNEIGMVELTFDFGEGVKVKVSKYHNPERGEFKIDIEDLNLKSDEKGVLFAPSYSPYLVDTDCKDCIPKPSTSPSCNGKVSSFPEGCVTITYEVFSKNLNSGKYVSEGINIKQFILTCSLEKQIAKLASDVIFDGQGCRYNYRKGGDKTKEIKENLILAWLKLNAIGEGGTGDCDCVTLELKRIREYLRYANSLR